jgi:hypothetical protein
MTVLTLPVALSAWPSSRSRSPSPREDSNWVVDGVSARAVERDAVADSPSAA